MSKLVRGKLAELYPDNVYSKVIDKNDHLSRLHVKVLEETFEVEEALKTGQYKDLEAEFADLLQAVEDYAHIAGISMLDIHKAKYYKMKERGDFLDGLILEECSLWERK